MTNSFLTLNIAQLVTSWVYRPSTIPKMTRHCILLAVASIGTTSGFMPTATLQKAVALRGVSSKSYVGRQFMTKQDDRAVTQVDVNDSKPDGFAESVYSLEREIAEALALDRTTTDASAFVRTEATIPEDLLAKEVISNMETVEAILAVAQQATEAAEASLPDLVSEGIPLIPTSEFNDTIAIPELSTHIQEADESGPMQSFDYPSVRRIIAFAASATGVYLCGPLLSLIDTSAVGLLSGTAQQAALNPAVAVTDYAALLIVRLKDSKAFVKTFAASNISLCRPSCTQVQPILWLRPKKGIEV